MLENPGRTLRTVPASSDNLHISEGPVGTLVEAHYPEPHYFISGPPTLKRLSVAKRPDRCVTARGRSTIELYGTSTQCCTHLFLCPETKLHLCSRDLFRKVSLKATAQPEFWVR